MTKNVNNDSCWINNAHEIPIVKLLRLLSSSKAGLSSEEAKQRRYQYGPNVLVTEKKLPEVVKFLRQFKNYFAILLVVGGCLALVADKLEPGQGNRYIAYALFGVVTLNAVFTYIQEFQVERIMDSFNQLLPEMATVVRDGVTKTIAATEIVPGDIMQLSEGDRVCADARVLEHHQLKIDLSSLTGESEPQLRHLEATHTNIIESRNMVFSGTSVQSGHGTVVVYSTGMQTQIGHIARLTKSTVDSPSPIRNELVRFTRIISLIGILLGIIFFCVSIVLGKGEISSVIFAIGIIVANVPEGLLPTVTLALTMASRDMAKKQALIKKLDSVETLGSTTVICTDKTGTLTQNRMAVCTIILNSDEFTAWNYNFISQPDAELCLQAMILCNNARFSNSVYNGDPTEVALITFASKLTNIAYARLYKRVDEFPFDSTTKRMIAICQNPELNGYTAWLKGAPETVVDKCSYYLNAGTRQSLTDSVKTQFIKDFKRLAQRGERVLALAFKKLETSILKAESEFTLIGLVGLHDPPRPEVADAIIQCRDAGVKVIMVTGDYGLTAYAIARQIGLIREKGTVVRGEELQKMSDKQLREILERPELVFARTTPMQKLRIVNLLQSLGHIVEL